LYPDPVFALLRQNHETLPFSAMGASLLFMPGQ
jgi:DNA-binding response OmpR family regulator